MQKTNAVEAVIETLSDYEIEHGKPMPNLPNGAIQANLIGLFLIYYGPKFRIASEVALATIPDGTTPDIVL